MIRFGIIGAGNIAKRFADSLSHLEEASLVAISARDPKKGRAFSEEFSVPFVYEKPEELLDNSEVDAVYIALPHGLHKEWSIRSMKAKKSVLCEKPAGICADELREIELCAKEMNVFFMEAMKPRFVPIYEKLKEVISEGVIGEVRSVEACLCRDFHFTSENTSYHLDPVMGGCLLDMGIYGASYLCDFLVGMPESLETKCRIRNGVDVYAASEISFPGGRIGRLECAFDEDKPEHVVIIGDAGKITVEHPSRPQKMIVETSAGREEVEVCYVVDDFYGEISHFVTCLENHQSESAIMPIKESIRCAALIDRIRAEI